LALLSQNGMIKISRFGISGVFIKIFGRNYK